MASTVLSGVNAPAYRNNTDQNVRIVINYMSSDGANNLVLNWSGVSAGGRYDSPTIIGRNLAHSTVIERSASGTIQTVQVGSLREGQPGFQRDAGPRGQGNFIFQAVPTSVDTAVAVSANNASGRGVALPTELMIAPGETFSAICGVYNIVVIPENG